MTRFGIYHIGFASQAMETIILPAEVAPHLIPQNYVWRKGIPNLEYPPVLHDIRELETFITKRIQDLQITSPNDIQKFAFKILNHVNLPKTALRHLRSNYLPSFSAMRWEDVFPLFQHSLTHNPPYDDHRNIPPYILQRSRLPITLFKSICSQLDTSRKTLGTREELQNETTVQLYFHPVPNTILGLFNGRMINLPEKILQGTILSAGRCKFTVTFFSKNILCFIEFKETLPTNAPAHSDVVAQVIAEMDGADTHNRENQYDGCPYPCYTHKWIFI